MFVLKFLKRLGLINNWIVFNKWICTNVQIDGREILDSNQKTVIEFVLFNWEKLVYLIAIKIMTLKS